MHYSDQGPGRDMRSAECTQAAYSGDKLHKTCGALPANKDSCPPWRVLGCMLARMNDSDDVEGGMMWGSVGVESKSACFCKF